MCSVLTWVLIWLFALKLSSSYPQARLKPRSSYAILNASVYVCMHVLTCVKLRGFPFVQLSVGGLQAQLSPTAGKRVSELVATQQQQQQQHQQGDSNRRRSFVPSADQLWEMDLQPGQNNIDFSFAGQRLRAYIYCCSWSSRSVL